jgi:hypothetical protein
MLNTASFTLSRQYFYEAYKLWQACFLYRPTVLRKVFNVAYLQFIIGLQVCLLT